ncbi:MAG: hypothetical protein PVJ53_15865 [Desulfobacterales bacterium]|jgi:hypothetical protein
MKKVKIGFWLILVAFLVLIGWQNKAFFLQQHRFDLDLWVTAPYTSPEIYNAALFAACFVVGLVIAYLSGLLGHYKANKTIKQLTAELQAQKTQAEQLRTEIEALKTVSTQAVPAADEDPEQTIVSSSASG